LLNEFGIGKLGNIIRFLIATKRRDEVVKGAVLIAAAAFASPPSSKLCEIRNSPKAHGSRVASEWPTTDHNAFFSKHSMTATLYYREFILEQRKT
jgi:hypothetical protein